jgi:ABC-type transport system substrate-binding protein
MAEAGYTRGADGIFVDASGSRFDPEIMNQPGAQPERETAIMREIWRRIGIDAHLELELSANTERRAMFPGLQAGGGLVQVSSLVSSAIGTPANRFAGSNRSGWSNSEYDALFARYSVSLDTNERNSLEAQMRRIQTEQLPGVPLFFNLQIAAWLSALKGPDPQTANVPNLLWDIHTWTL